MADIDDRQHDHEEERLVAPARVSEDTRKPYEPPRLLKKRSVARSTLFTAMGVTMNAITMMG